MRPVHATAHIRGRRYPPVEARGWTHSEDVPPPSVLPAKAGIQGRGGSCAAVSPLLLGSRFHGSDGWRATHTQPPIPAEAGIQTPAVQAASGRPSHPRLACR